jgi:hypothetical protein
MAAGRLENGFLSPTRRVFEARSVGKIISNIYDIITCADSAEGQMNRKSFPEATKRDKIRAAKSS